ncbi:hypothetical protein VTN96DRAFT_3810 [Rasamsonia emersonii]
MGLLSLTVLIMVFAIIRVAVVASPTRNEDITWLWLWSFIETAVAIIVASLASFRQLYTKNDSCARVSRPRGTGCYCFPRCNPRTRTRTNTPAWRHSCLLRSSIESDQQSRPAHAAHIGLGAGPRSGSGPGPRVNVRPHRRWRLQRTCSGSGQDLYPPGTADG